MRLLIFGTGSVGGLMGARLALAGHDINFLARPPIVKALLQDGLTLIEKDQSTHIQVAHAYSELAEVLGSARPEVILICVKAYDCQETANMLAQNLSEHTPVLSLLNGINNEHTLGEALGSTNVIPGTLTTAVRMTAPGVVQVTKRRGVGLAGDHPLAQTLVEVLKHAGFHSQHYPDPSRMKWSKLMTNIVSNATSAITGLDPAQVFAHPGLARLEIDSLRETVRVMRKLGFTPQNLPKVSVALLGAAIFLPPFFTRFVFGRILASARGGKKPSLHYDIGRGKSEVDWLNGAVARYGDRLGVPTPVNHALNRTMQRLVRDESAHADYLGQPDMLLARVYSTDGSRAG